MHIFDFAYKKSTGWKNRKFERNPKTSQKCFYARGPLNKNKCTGNRFRG